MRKLLALSFGVALTLLPQLALAHGNRAGLRSRGPETVAAEGDWLFWDFHPSIIIGILTLTILYTLGITVWRRRFKLSDTVPKGRVALFYFTMVLQWFTIDGPLHHLSDELLFSAHMVQHLILQLIWAPLLLISMPPWLLEPLFKVELLRKAAVKLARPPVAFVLINVMLVFWHIPRIYNLALEIHELHILQHLIFMSTAVLFWWPVLGSARVPGLARPTYGVLLLYLLISTLPMKGLGLSISVREEVIYTFYSQAPRVWGLSPLGDQRTGGLLMWVPAGIFLWIGAAYVFNRWIRTGTPRRGRTGIPEIDQRLDEAEARRAQGPSAAPQELG